MPLLGALLVSLFGGIASWLAEVVTRKVVVAGAAITAFGVATVALLAAFNGLVAPLVARAFSTSYGQVIGLAFPPVAGTCLATLGACWAACALYKWQAAAIKLGASA